MAPSSGAVFALLGRASKKLRLAWAKASHAVESRLESQAAAQHVEAKLQPLYARIAPKHPIHPVAALKQSRGRWYTTHAAIKSGARNFGTSTRAASWGRAEFRSTRVGSALSRLPGQARAPFASTLRPSLTGGTLCRTAGGYSLGGGRIGGARYFSHAPAAPAQVVQNVSQAVRAFMIGGRKAQFDGVDPATGNKRYRAVSALQDEASRKITSVPRASPGSFVDFHVNPTITALTPLGSIAGFPTAPADSYAQPLGNSLQTSGLLDVLSVDFARALRDLSLILSDLKTLSSLGDLPITYRDSRSCLRVHFPGCDAGYVETLCDELDIRRGVVGQDPEFDDYVGTEIALLFPFAPSKTVSECGFYERPVQDRLPCPGRLPVSWRDMLSPSSGDGSVKPFSTRSNYSFAGEESYDNVGGMDESNPWLSSPSGYESVESSPVISQATDRASPLEFQGFEGLYRFMEMCDESDRRQLP